MANQSVTTPSYKMEPFPGLGFGMIATRAIPRGTLIISEPPLFTVRGNFSTPSQTAAAIQAKVQALSEADKKVFFSLHNSYAQDPKVPAAHGIVKTNGHPLGVDSRDCGIFPECSRFNHSCASNASYAWNPASGREAIYAGKDIALGEQITVTYLDEERLNKKRSDRRALLREEFQFECNCNVCGAPPAVVAASDRRRTEIARLDELIGGGGRLVLTNPGKFLGYCKRILELYDEEGMHDITLYRTYNDALQICIMNGDLARASAFASLGVHIKQLCQGVDAPRLEEVQPFVKNPEKHQYAGVSNKWRTKKESVRGMGEVGFEKWLWSRAE